MAFNATWIQTRKKLLKQIQSRVRSFLGKEDAEFKSFRKAYAKEFSGKWKPTTKDNFIMSLSVADYILGSDFHAFSQSQRVHLRILRNLPIDCKIILCLECISSCYQQELDKFLVGKLSEDQFLKSIEWEKNWGFPWRDYKPLFEWAQKNKVPCFGINREFLEDRPLSLEEREEWSARLIFEIKRKYPDHLPYVVFGDLHLAEERLPQKILSHYKSTSSNFIPKHQSKRSVRVPLDGVKNVFSKVPPKVPPKIVRIFQNSEKLYFQLAKKKKENQFEILKKDEGTFCILASPPWVQWQSYLLFLEHNQDVFLLDLDEDEINEGEIDEDESESLEEFIPEFTEHVKIYVDFLSKELHAKINLNHLEVYSNFDDEVLESFFDSHQDSKWLKFLLENEKSFFYPQENFLYLARPSMVHVTMLAAYYFHESLSKYKQWPTPDHIELEKLIWLEAVNFFLTKLINPNRKCISLERLRKELEIVDPKQKGKEDLLLVLSQSVLERYRFKTETARFVPQKSYSHIVASRYLGQVMGEKLFLYTKKEKISFKQIKAWLKVSVYGEDFDIFYQKMVMKLNTQELNKNLWENSRL